MTTVPETEPRAIRAGDTLVFRRSFEHYPAPTWTLTYTLVNGSARYTFAATADGADHLVSVAMATTAQWAAGAYDWVATVTDGTSRFEVSRGRITVRPDIGEAVDLRSHARKALDAIEAVLESRASKDQESFEIAGRKLTRTPVAELIRLRSYYQAEVSREAAAERIRKGLGGPRRIGVRLG